jgi:transcriptional regulator with XRE-family HTH domain
MTIAALMDKKNINQMDMARASGLSLNAVHRIYKGQSSPTVETLQKIAEVLNVPVGKLLE